MKTFNVYDKDGTVYTFPAAGGPCGTAANPTCYTPPTSIEDRNGNVVSMATTGSILTDTAGRTLSLSGFGPSGTTNTVRCSPCADQNAIL